jgi:mannose-6-phosphate isomerase-like protein (cupin superfamily)
MVSYPWYLKKGTYALPDNLHSTGIILITPSQQAPTFAWAPLPAQPTTWVAPNKPIWKLADLLAQHKGQQNWSETVVSDNQLHADYISMAPVQKPRASSIPITEPGGLCRTFVATKGYLVQVPYRTVFSMETVGDKPSLRLEVNIAGAKTMYPIDEPPTPLPGFNFVKVRIEGQGKYDARNKPYIDFNAVVAGTEKQRRFIADNRAVAHIIIGDPKKQAPVTDANGGHFHEESPEFWIILLGKMEYKIGSLPIFVADQGDIVYAPAQTWHRARFAGTELACRLAMNGYQDLLHLYQPPE